MSDYLNCLLDWRNPEIASIYNDISLWGAPFGLLFLKHFPFPPSRSRILDVGFGTGFPLLELAQRFGQRAELVGIDPWTAAVNIARQKAKTLQLTNVEIIEGDAAAMPFESASFDWITSNLGLHNFENPQAALQECYRVLKPGGRIAICTNLSGTFQEFFDCFAELLEEREMTTERQLLQNHIDHRGTIDSITQLFESTGFSIRESIKDQNQMRFADGTAFFRHGLILIGFLDPWKNIIEASQRATFFTQLEMRLNEQAQAKGELKLRVPMWYAAFEK